MNKLQSKFAAVLLALMCGFLNLGVTNADPTQPPEISPPKRYFNEQPDTSHLANITEVMVVLKPAMRTYANLRYDWGNGKKELRREEMPMSVKDLRKIRVAAGIELKLKLASSSVARAIPEGTPMTAAEASKFSKVDGLELVERTHLLLLPYAMTLKEAEEIAARIRTLPEILYADPSVGGNTSLIPADPLFNSQWNLKSAGGGANLPPAWDITTGKNTLVVAVIDSGVLASHPELSGRVLTGYDFITSTTRANDGDGRDANPADPGNWVTAAEAVAPCKTRLSAWHGTRVASIIAANANNNIGMAGVDWQVRILPIRVAGKCTSGSEFDGNDLIDAIRWAAGYAVVGIPTNANPAKVINISLGGVGPCNSLTQAAIDSARKKGAVVVAAVGNSGATASQQPANCNGVIRVAAVDTKGGLASYSNRGESASLSAPGGDVTDALPLYTAGDGGTTVALNDGAITGDRVGTSYAAPHVSGVAALMLALKPKMNPNQVRQCLLQTVRNFPTGTSFDCDSLTCGTGLLDAGQAVRGTRATQAGGIYHTAAVKSDGSIVAWGFNGNGQLGGGETLGLVRAYPGTPIASLSNMRDVATGSNHTVASRGDGTVWSWGYNGKGQLGNSTITDTINPVQVTGLTNVIAVAGGDLHTLALKADGTVWAWGYNFFGQLGRAPNNYTDSTTPVQVYGLTDVIAIAGAGKRSLALKKDGTVWAWGTVSNVTSDTSASISAAPIQVAGLAEVVAIAAGGDATTGNDVDVSMALTWDGKVYTWGYNAFGQLGLGHTSTKFLPKEVISLPKPAVSISTSGMHSLAILEDGTQWAWGLNSGGMLGDGTTTPRSSPVQVVGALAKVIDITAARYHTLALHGDLTVHAWGDNSGGQLGEGTQTARTTPQLVHGASNIGIYNAGYATSTRADMGIVLSDSPDPALSGSNLTYDLQLINYGPDTATGVSAVLSLPSQTTFISATTGCSFANASVTCTRTSLNSAANATFQVVVKPTSAATLNATASVSSGIYDPATSNNVAGTSTVASAAAPTDGDVPLPAWALVLLGAGLFKTLRSHQLRAST